MNSSETIGEFSKAMSLLQGELHDAVKDTTGYGWKYAKLPQILQILRPLLQKNNLSVIQNAEFRENTVFVETKIMHSSGEWNSGVLGSPFTVGKGFTTPQALGSTISFLRRYALMAMFAMASEDDDDDGMSAGTSFSTTSNDVDSRRLEVIEKIKNAVNNDQNRIDKICGFYKVEKIEHLTFSQAKDALDKLEKGEAK